MFEKKKEKKRCLSSSFRNTLRNDGSKREKWSSGMFKAELEMFHTYYPSTRIENQAKMSYQISGKLVREGRIKVCLVSEILCYRSDWNTTVCKSISVRYSMILSVYLMAIFTISKIEVVRDDNATTNYGILKIWNI